MRGRKKDKNCEYIGQYSNGDEYIDYNSEYRDLDTIRVDLPPTPDWTIIDGYGLPAKEQKFKQQKIPYRLEEFENMRDSNGSFLTQDEIWEKIEQQPEFYKEEIEFIRLQWKRRLEGYWFFNNGKATYIDGWHYFFLNFWKLPKGLPKYRDRDRRFFLFARFCYNDPSCFGFVYPKHRREGATTKAGCINFLITSLDFEVISGIQSKTDKDSFLVYQKHIIYPWRKLPFFFKPNHNGGDDPQNLLSFKPIGSRGAAGQKKASKKGLFSEITYMPSNEKAYDGFKLIFYHHDELGKVKNINILERWDCAKLCLSEGAGGVIDGFSIHTSTVGDMETGGGEAMKKLCNDSQYNNRNDNGQTASGLYVLFMGAADGLKGYIDEYGLSIIDTPTEEQKKFLKTYTENGKVVCPNPEIGARQFILNTTEHLKKSGDKEKLNQHLRDHPLEYRECFRTNSNNTYFDLMKIEDRLDELALDRKATVRGNFVWRNKYKPHKSEVDFIPDEYGRFYLSIELAKNETNRVSWDSSIESWVPNNLHYCAGSDPFRNDKTISKINSMGGGAVFWGRDMRKDPFDKPMEDWISNRFICTYKFRPNTHEEYCEDMAMMCMYFGCPMCTESNVEHVRKYFEDNYMAAMLIYEQRQTLTKTEFQKLAGINTGTRIQEEVFKLYRSYIYYHCHRERHSELLIEVRDIRDTTEMTKYDLFVAGGMAMLGIDNYWKKAQKEIEQQEQEESHEFFPVFSYR